MSLLQMSFAGAVMILAIIVIRALAINLLPKKTFLVLWGIVVMRLLLPFSIPSAFSVYSLIGNHAPTANPAKGPQTVGMLPTEIAGQMTVVPNSSSNTASPISMWVIVWTVGMLVCALVFAAAYWKCRQEFHTSLPVDNDFIKGWLSSHRLKRVISVRQSSRFSAPLTYGVFRPVILMPTSTDWENTKSLQYVLTHEYVHTQLFNLLCEKADDVYGGRLPVHVRCLIDECANIGQIPNLEKLVATIRSREISACLVLQAQSQLKAIYKDNADTIIGNMDTRIFLGGSEPTTIKELNAALGKETIDSFNTSDTRGNSPSYGTSYQKLGHELMSQDEIAVMDGGKCILQLRGVRPFFSDKYDITKHPNYKYLSDADPRNAFNIEKFLSTQLRPKPEESYEVFEINVDEEDGDGEDGIPAFVPDL